MCTFVHVCDTDVAERTCRISVIMLVGRIRIAVTRVDGVYVSSVVVAWLGMLVFPWCRGGMRSARG